MLDQVTGRTTSPGVFSLTGIVSTLTLGLFMRGDYANGDSHLLGQHTVRMSPISTAQLNPYGQTYCLSSPSSSVLIPVLLNNSNPNFLRYSLIPLGYGEGSVGKIEQA